MLNRDFTNSTLNVIRSTMPKIEAPIQPDWAGIIRQAGKDYNEGALTRKMIDEHPEDEALIRQKGGSVYADMLKADAERAEDRQWALDDRQAQRDFQREMLDAQTQRAFALENLRNQNARSLAEFKAGLGGDTTAQKNIGYLQTLGYSPEEAAALYYSGNNPTLNMENFGKKAQEKFGSETGKNYAEDINSYNNMTSKMPELMDTVSRLNELGQNATYTKGGQLLDVIRRETGMSPRQSAVDRAAYISMIDNQILPLLRDTFGAQFTEREGNTLRKTLGDANSTPEEKNAQLNAFIRQKQMSIESQKRKLDSYNQPSLADFNQIDINDPKVKEALDNGYSMEEIKAYLGK